MINRTLVGTLMTLFFLTGLALSGFDQSRSTGAENLSMADSTVQTLEADTGTSLANAQAPQMPATGPGTELAFYATQPPTKTDLNKLLPFSAKVSPSTYVFYKGSYLGWSGFTSQFPNTPGLWIERSMSWSWYVTMPLGGWARELLYVPVASPISMYEIYPGGYVKKYDLGFVQPGYYYIWYYADAPGRHFNVFGVSSGYSNMVVVDVYGIPGPKPTPPKPVPPDPKKECEKNSLCVWENGKCDCFNPAPNPVAECEKNPNCRWAEGQCLCTMPNPDDQEREKCEQNLDCDWINGQCLCRGGPMPGPVPNPNPVEPIPGPVPNPNPEPNPGPSPTEICQQNPGCHWENGQCLCTGAGGDSAGGAPDDNSDTMTQQA